MTTQPGALGGGPITMIICSRGKRGGRSCQVIQSRLCPDCEQPMTVSVTSREAPHQCSLLFG